MATTHRLLVSLSPRLAVLRRKPGSINHSMAAYQFILPLIALVGCQPWTPQPYVPVVQPIIVEEYPVTGAAPVILPQGPVFAAPSGVIAGPPFVQPPPVIIQQGPQIAPAGPPHPSNNLPPPPAAGPVFGPPLGQAPTLPTGPLADIAPGGMMSPQFGLPAGPEAMPPLPSSISVPVANDEWAWDQIADVVSDYFTIVAEQPARRGGEVGSEGRIDTAWQDGATWLEPHRNDSVGSFNRWESTFQTIRRRAAIRVTPSASPSPSWEGAGGGGYTIEAVVDKELEYLPHPERATAGAAAFRNDGSLPSRREEPVSRTRASPSWIPLGRDPPLEQRMLAEIHARLTGAASGPTPTVFTQ